MRLLTRSILASLFVSSAALARPPSVYINDVKVDGLHGQTLSNVDVVFDDNGDVRITAKGYKVTKLDPTPATPAPQQAAVAPTPAAAPAAHHFYIATMQPPGREGAAGWDVDVYVNQVFVKRFRSKDPEPIYEITRFLKPGANTLHFTPRRDDGEHRSVSPSDYFELVVGDGEMRAGQVMLTKISSFRRTAADTAPTDAETTLYLAVQ